MNPLADNRRHITRRALFGRTATGIGTAALAQLLSRDLMGATAAGLTPSNAISPTNGARRNQDPPASPACRTSLPKRSG